MAHEISTGKSICILGTVVACFAVLWPNIFYPMLKGSVSLSSEGCCDVLLDKDVNGVKLVNELCSTVLKLSDKYDSNFYFSTNRLNKDAVKECRNVVLETCDIDINALLKDTIELDTKYKHVLDDIRTFNKSLCLKYHFDITLDLLGTPHRVKKYNLTTATNYYRQERKSRAKVEGLHPAFRQASPPRRLDEDPSIIYHDEEDTPPPPITTIHHEAVAGKKPPVPGMRPTVGGNGYVAQHKGSGTMGILMPMYTIGIVAFFTYTILRLLSKKPDNQNNFMHDPEFCRNVFSNNDSQEKSSATANADPASKLGDIEIDHLRRRLAETEATMDRIVKQMNLVSMTLAKPLNESIISAESAETKVDKAAEELNGKDIDHDEDSNEMEKVNGIVKVIGMELNESCENGKPWKRSPSPPAVKTPPPQITPQEIILPGNVPINSQILVSDAHTENISNESNVILESKVTLNVISPDLNNESESENENENLEINGLKSAHNDDVVEKETNQMNGHNSANDFEVSDSASENRNGGRNESDDESEDEQENTEL